MRVSRKRLTRPAGVRSFCSTLTMPKVYKDFDRQTWTFTKYYNPVVYQPIHPNRLLNLELFWTFLDIFRGNKKAYTILGAGIGHGVGAVLRTILEASTPQCEGIANSTNVKLSNLEEAPHIVLYFVLYLTPTIAKQLKTKQLTTPIVPRVGLTANARYHKQPLATALTQRV